MNFAFTEEQDELRSTIRAFMEAKSSEEAVREQMETDNGFDSDVWTQMAEQMGLQGLHIPEEYGGSGFGYVELGIVLEEMGRALLCAPFFSSVVLAANTLMQSGDDAAKSAHLPGIAAGSTIATVAFTEPNGKWDEAGITMEASGSGSDVTLNGTKSFVLDGHLADLIIVAARSSAGVSLYTVAGDAAGLTRTALSTMDQTRRQAKLEFSNTPATLLGAEGKGWDILSTVLDLAAIGLAAEQAIRARNGSSVRKRSCAVRTSHRLVPGHQAQVRRHAPRGRISEISCILRPLVCKRNERRTPFGRIAREGLLLRGVFPRHGREHSDSRRYRLHLGAPRTPLLQACQVVRAAVR